MLQNNTSVITLDTSLIVPNKYQPRKIFEDTALNSLAESIKNYGIINPILVRKKDDKYEIIAGERRFRAAKQIGLTEVPVIIKNADEQQMAELALIENIQRQELSPIEEAKSYEEIMRIGNQTQASLAEKLGKSQSSIANKIRLLSLPQEIQDALANKKISERHARSLISVEDSEQQIKLLNKIITEKLTVKETEQLINENQINDEEIKQAISDIMKSLNIKEEEKEDDNMNNGNFFPNFDNNNVANNTSLNMMNMQSMNSVPMEPVQEVVMPTTQMVQEPMMQASQMTPPVVEQPQVANQMENQYVPPQNNVIMPNMGMNNNINPIPNFMGPQENSLINPIDNVETPIINDTSLFNVESQTTEQPPVVEQPQVSTPMIDVPLFNPNITMPSAEQAMNAVQEPQMMNPVQNVELEVVTSETQPVMETTTVEPTSFEIPVATPSTIDVSVTNEPVQEVSVTTDRLSALKELLTANGFTYKVYSNETDNCVIIELPNN